MTNNIGTIYYCSPEVMDNSKNYTEKCDVYSFGIIMYEVLFEVTPYSNLALDSILTLALEIIKGRRPTYPEDANYSNDELDFLQLMQQCWSAKPDDRPMFSEVLTRLDELSN